LTHRLKDGLVAVVVDPFAQGHVDRVVLALAVPDILSSGSKEGCGESHAKSADRARKTHPDVSRSWEELLVELMERGGQDPVGCVEGLLDSISVMDVNVDVKHTGMHTEQL
jgi:hypothetical protein